MSDDLKARLGGIAMLLIGIAFGWYFIWQPLQAAQAGAPNVSMSIKAMVVAPLAILTGLYLLITGNRYEYRTADHKNLTPLGWALIAVIAVAAFGTYFWMQSTLAGLGYS